MPSLKDRLAAFANPTQRVAEGVKVDPDDDLYRNIGADYRDLLGSTLRRSQDISVDLYRKNPLANRIVKIYTTYMAGAGFSLDCDNPEVQEWATEFWTAERNQMTLNHRRFARDFLLYGEAPHPIGVDETGNTTIGYLDPRKIERVETSPLNSLLLETVVLTTEAGSERLEVVRRNTDPFSDGAGLLGGDIFYWLHDRIGSGTRGTPFLLGIIDWLDAYDQTLWELIERIKATRAFFWDVAVEGGATEVADAKAQWGTTAPRSGSVRFRTKSMEINATQPSIGAAEDVAAVRYLLRHIGTGVGLPPHWLGEPEDANRSTAETMDKPTLRSLEEMQLTWKANMESVLKLVIDRKVEAGILDRRMERFDETGEGTGQLEPASDLVEVLVPVITDEDVVSAATAIAAVAGAFVQLDLIDVAGRESMRAVIRHLLPALGIPAEELPDAEDEETTDEEMMGALESIYNQANPEKVAALLAETD